MRLVDGLRGRWPAALCPHPAALTSQIPHHATCKRRRPATDAPIISAGIVRNTLCNDYCRAWSPWSPSIIGRGQRRRGPSPFRRGTRCSPSVRRIEEVASCPAPPRPRENARRRTRHMVCVMYNFVEFCRASPAHCAFRDATGPGPLPQDQKSPHEPSGFLRPSAHPMRTANESLSSGCYRVCYVLGAQYPGDLPPDTFVARPSAAGRRGDH